jgi:hypothetical protein
MSFSALEVLPPAKRILGVCDTHKLYELMTYGVEILANTGEFDPLTGYVDLCTESLRIVTLPRDIDTVIAVNIGGKPSLGRDQLYNFHYNGLGDCAQPCGYSWQDLGPVPTLRELSTPSKLVAFVEHPDDAGAELWAYGIAPDGSEIRTITSNGAVSGYQVPTIYGYALPDPNAPVFARVTRIRKAETLASIKLTSFDYGVGSGTLLGVFQWDELEPSYRRIRLHQTSPWCRIAYRKAFFSIKSDTDLIPLPSKPPFIAMLHAMKYYDEGDLARAAGYEATARRWLNEAVAAHASPVQTAVQVNDNISVAPGDDRID